MQWQHQVVLLVAIWLSKGKLTHMRCSCFNFFSHMPSDFACVIYEEYISVVVCSK